MQGQWGGAATHHVVGLRLSDQDQDVGADDGQAEVEQDDGSFRADVSVDQRQERPEAPGQSHPSSVGERWGVGGGCQTQRRGAIAAFFCPRSAITSIARRRSPPT